MSVVRESIEAELRVVLLEHYRAEYGSRLEGYVDNLLATAPYAGRFAYLNSVVPVRGSGRTVLISGFGAGSEMLLAREFGFGRVIGVEIDRFLVSICERRVAHLEGMTPLWYDGSRLPVADGEVDVVASGHIVEHTADPLLYIRECLRVLAPAGVLSLEFPTRFHWTELHTGLPSIEWLPAPFRDRVLRLLSGPRSPLREDVRSRYESIVNTGLKQISFGWVRRAVARSGYRAEFLSRARPAPGVVRCVIRRVGTARQVTTGS